MFMFAMTLAIISTAIEMFLAGRFKFIHHLFVKYTVIGLIFSFALSYGIGVAFGAAGLIAMFGAILSTVLSYICYEFDLVRFFTPAMITETKKKINHVVMITAKTIKWMWLTVTAPVRFGLWVIERAKRAKMKAQPVINWARAKRAHS